MNKASTSNQVNSQKVKGNKTGGQERSSLSSNSYSEPDNSVEKSWVKAWERRRRTWRKQVIFHSVCKWNHLKWTNMSVTPSEFLKIFLLVWQTYWNLKFTTVRYSMLFLRPVLKMWMSLRFVHKLTFVFFIRSHVLINTYCILLHLCMTIFRRWIQRRLYSCWTLWLSGH